MSAGSGSGSGDKLGVFLLGMLAGMAAISLVNDAPKRSRRYEEYRREKQRALAPAVTFSVEAQKLGALKR